MNAFAALEGVETAGAETLFCGHTHQPYVRELLQVTIRVKVQQHDQGAPTEQELELPMRRIVNWVTASWEHPSHLHHP